MIALRCTAKLLKRLRQPAKLPEPPPSDNPLGEWYADLDFLDRQPFVLLLNAATGVMMALPGRAEVLRELHTRAGQQLFKLFLNHGFEPEMPGVGEELRAWQRPPVYANTRDRSLLGSLNRYRLECWHHLADGERSLLEVAARQWDGLFRHPSLAPPGRRHRLDGWHRPLDLLRERLASSGGLVPADAIIPARSVLH